MQSVALAPKTAEVWDFVEPGEEAVWTLGTASEKKAYLINIHSREFGLKLQQDCQGPANPHPTQTSETILFTQENFRVYLKELKSCARSDWSICNR